MKKITILATTLVALSIMILSWNSVQKLEAAARIDDFGCVFQDGDGGWFWADKSSVVITSSGNHNLVCQASGVPNSTGKAVVRDGFLCNAYGAITDQTHETVSASGNATLTCQANPE